MDSCCWLHTAIPTPGSDNAHKVGCTCPTLDNAHGQGFPWPREDGRDPEQHPSYWINGLCVLHAPKEPENAIKD